MTIRKSNVLLNLVNSYVIDSPQPSNINYWWNLGSLLATVLIIQLATGIFLAMHYSSNIELAFYSVQHIMNEVHYGWVIRYCHSNGAAFFFIFIYMHMARGLYYGSYKSPRIAVWYIGVVIFLLLIITGFLGYKNNSPKSYNIRKYNNISNKTCLSYKNQSKLNNKLNFINKRNYSTNNKNYRDLFDELKINPIYYFDDLHKEETKKEINKTLKGLSGIYIIINKVTKNFYIGSAITNQLHKRFYRHCISLLGSKPVKDSINKYGLDNFIFGILEIFPEKVNKENNKELIKLEDTYLKTYLPNFNILLEAGNSFGYKHTEDSKLRMKLVYTEERKELLRQIQYNRKNKWTEEEKEKLRQIALNRPKNYWSEEGLKRISEASSRKITLLSINNEILCEFNKIEDIASYLNCSYKTIQRALIKGIIYIPMTFEHYLNNEYYNKYKSLPLDKLNNAQLNIMKTQIKNGINYRIPNKGIKLKAGLKKNFCFNKYILK